MGKPEDRDLEQRRIASCLVGRFELRQVFSDALDERSQLNSQVIGRINLDLGKAHAPELDRPDENALFPFEVSCGNLDYALIEFPVLAMLLQPDLLQGFVALKEFPAVELFDAFEKSRIETVFHRQVARAVRGFAPLLNPLQ